MMYYYRKKTWFLHLGLKGETLNKKDSTWKVSF